jgi:hypothetical protein
MLEGHWEVWCGGGAYHQVCAVENQGQEQREAAEVHVALRVELAGLNFHALMSENSPTNCG